MSQVIYICRLNMALSYLFTASSEESDRQVFESQAWHLPQVWSPASHPSFPPQLSHVWKEDDICFTRLVWISNKIMCPQKSSTWEALSFPLQFSHCLPGPKVLNFIVCWSKITQASAVNRIIAHLSAVLESEFTEAEREGNLQSPHF